MSTLWSIGQACVWITTRNAEAAAHTGKRDAIRKLLQEVLPASNCPNIWDALQDLQQRFRDGPDAGGLNIAGRKRGAGNRDAIEQGERKTIELEDGSGEEIVAQHESPLSGGWWSDLVVSADDVRRLWPVPREKAELPADDATVTAWMQSEILTRRASGERTTQPAIVLATTQEFRGRLTERRARALYKKLPKEMKGKRGPKGPRVS